MNASQPLVALSAKEIDRRAQVLVEKDPFINKVINNIVSWYNAIDMVKEMRFQKRDGSHSDTESDDRTCEM